MHSQNLSGLNYCPVGHVWLQNSVRKQEQVFVSRKAGATQKSAATVHPATEAEIGTATVAVPVAPVPEIDADPDTPVVVPEIDPVAVVPVAVPEIEAVPVVPVPEIDAVPVPVVPVPDAEIVPVPVAPAVPDADTVPVPVAVPVAEIVPDPVADPAVVDVDAVAVPVPVPSVVDAVTVPVCAQTSWVRASVVAAVLIILFVFYLYTLCYTLYFLN